MTALVTGATGFVGSHLLDQLLARGTEVRVLVRDAHKAEDLRQRGVDVRLGDVREPGVMALLVRDIDVVYHCAAAVGPHHSRQTIYETNLTGVLHVLHALRQRDRGRLVLLSSINVLGSKDLDPATEDSPCCPSNDAAADVKIDVEKLAVDYHRQHGVRTTILRPGFIYGPRDPHNLPRLMRALRRDKFSFIGSRDNVVPIVHVADLVQAMLLAGNCSVVPGRVYHISDGSRTTIGQFVDRLADLLGCPSPKKVRPLWLARTACAVLELVSRWRGRPPPISRAALRFLGTSRFVDISRARAELGYQPRIGYQDGLADALRWFTDTSGSRLDARLDGESHAVPLSP